MEGALAGGFVAPIDVDAIDGSPDLPDDAPVDLRQDYMFNPANLRAVLRPYRPLFDRGHTTARGSEAAALVSRFLLEPGSDAQPTHVSMNGGRLRVADRAAQNLFDELRARLMLCARRTYFVELLTPVFKLCVDLDFEQPRRLAPAQMVAAGLCVLETALKFFPDAPEPARRVVLLVTEPKFKPAPAGAAAGTGIVEGSEAPPDEDDDPERVLERLLSQDTDPGAAAAAAAAAGGPAAASAAPPRRGTWKSGAHLVFPQLLVDRDQAEVIRSVAVSDLKDTFGARGQFLNPWESVVDDNIYRANGGSLRMTGCHKIGPCPDCKRDEAPSRCRTCDGRGRVDEGRPYFPLCVLRPGGRDHDLEERYRADPRRMLKDTSVRVPDFELADLEAAGQRARFVTPPGAPRPEDIRAARELAQRARPRGGGGGGGGGGGAAGGGGGAAAGDLDPMNPAVGRIETFLRGRHPRWANLRVHRVRTSATRFLVNVQGAGCRFCLNKGAEHGSSVVYFVLKRDGCTQRCFSPKAPDPRAVPCSRFVSGLFPIPADLSALLFEGGGSGPGRVAPRVELPAAPPAPLQVALGSLPRALRGPVGAADDPIRVQREIGAVIARLDALCKRYHGGSFTEHTGLVTSLGGVQRPVDPGALGTRERAGAERMGVALGPPEPSLWSGVTLRPRPARHQVIESIQGLALVLFRRIRDREPAEREAPAGLFRVGAGQSYPVAEEGGWA